MNRPASLAYKIRTGSRRDINEVLRIFFAALAEHGFDPSPVNLNEEVARFGSGVEPTQDDFVAVSGGKIVGFLVLLGRTSGCGELAKVFVAPSHRNRGVGTMLIDECIATARRRGYRKLVLETHVAFRAARRYYERHGWTRGPDLPSGLTDTPTYSLDLTRPVSGRCPAT